MASAKKKGPAASNKEPNVFIAWSGTRSRAVAEALVEWLPTMIDAVQPWMSKESIRAGQNWFAEVTNALISVKMGIVCVTPENLKSEWIHFESGAIANKVAQNSRVIPYLIGVQGSAVLPPLSVFQHRDATKESTHRLIQEVNEFIGATVPEKMLDARFESFWPSLEKAIKASVAAVSTAAPKKRPMEEMVEEMLELVRGLRADVPPRPPKPPLAEAFLPPDLPAPTVPKVAGLMIGNTPLEKFLEAVTKWAEKNQTQLSQKK